MVSVRDEAAVDGQRDAEHEAGAGAASQRTAAAISSARPRRPIGWSRMNCFIASGWLWIRSAAIGVSITPGQTALMRMPRGA